VACERERGRSAKRAREGERSAAQTQLGARGAGRRRSGEGACGASTAPNDARQPRRAAARARARSSGGDAAYHGERGWESCERAEARSEEEGEREIFFVACNATASSSLVSKAPMPCERTRAIGLRAGVCPPYPETPSFGALVGLLAWRLVDWLVGSLIDCLVDWGARGSRELGSLGAWEICGTQRRGALLRSRGGGVRDWLRVFTKREGCSRSLSLPGRKSKPARQR